MKQIRTLFILIFSIFLFACSKRDRQVETNDKIRILSTTVQIGDMVESIGRDRIAHSVLIRGDIDPHSYELVKGDDEKMGGADLIFYNGLGLEHGASLIEWLKHSSKATALGDQLAKQNPEKILMQDGVVDPHIWMDLSLWEKTIDPIVEGLSKQDPEFQSFYEANGASLKEKMASLDREIRAILDEVPENRRYLVTSHDAFHYFARKYLALENEPSWGERVRAPEGLAPDGQMSPMDLQNVIEYIAKHQVQMLFPESNVNPDAIQKISFAGKELGLNVFVCREPLYGDATSGLSYFDSMLSNAKTIATHLKEKK